MADGNGAPIGPAVPPLSQEEYGELLEQFKKRGLPVILYIFNGPESVSANRIMHEANYRQMAAVATELDEWARIIFRKKIAAMEANSPKLAQAGIITPEELRGQGQG